jgi:hypothetical protein
MEFPHVEIILIDREYQSVSHSAFAFLRRPCLRHNRKTLPDDRNFISNTYLPVICFVTIFYPIFVYSF